MYTFATHNTSRQVAQGIVLRVLLLYIVYREHTHNHQSHKSHTQIASLQLSPLQDLLVAHSEEDPDKFSDIVSYLEEEGRGS